MCSTSCWQPPALVLEVFFGGATAGRAQLLEDAGDDDAYTHGEIAISNMSFLVGPIATGRATISLKLEPVTGGFRGMLTTRHVEWRLHNVLAPTAAVHAYGGGCSGAPIEIWWEATTLTAHVLARDVNVSCGAAIEVTLLHDTAAGASVDFCSPFPGVSRRVAALRQSIDDERKSTQGSMALNRLEETAVRMANNPATAAAELAAYHTRVSAAVQLHTSATVGAPTLALKTQMAAWLGE